jgi:hypothetical protein
MDRKPLIIEVILATIVVALNALICVLIGIWGCICMEEVYGHDPGFSWLTILGCSAHKWSPILFCIALGIYFYTRIKRRETLLAFCILSVLTSGVSAVVAYGVVFPFTRTTFRMGNHEQDR